MTRAVYLTFPSKTRPNFRNCRKRSNLTRFVNRSTNSGWVACTDYTTRKRPTPKQKADHVSQKSLLLSALSSLASRLKILFVPNDVAAKFTHPRARCGPPSRPRGRSGVRWRRSARVRRRKPQRRGCRTKAVATGRLYSDKDRPMADSTIRPLLAAPPRIPGPIRGCPPTPLCVAPARSAGFRGGVLERFDRPPGVHVPGEVVCGAQPHPRFPVLCPRAECHPTAPIANGQSTDQIPRWSDHQAYDAR